MALKKMRDLTGQRFGRIYVVGLGEKRKCKNGTRVYWDCECNCGNRKLIRSDALTSGVTISCGCYKDEVFEKENRRKPKHGMTKTRLYTIWINMRSRCNKEKDVSYKDYGGRGIKVCEEWSESFENFLSWAMKSGYREDLTIERVDNDKGYSPGNCKWSDIYEQANNKRSNIRVEIDGEVKTLAEWARSKRMNYQLVKSRYRNGKRGKDLFLKREMNGMRLNDYQELASRTIPKDKDSDKRVAEFCVGLCEEAGESAGVLKKVVFHEHPLTYEKRIKLKEELGDTLWHISALAEEYGLTLEEIASGNIEKLKRRYPEGFSVERSVNRSE